ncbi:hypothetical protein E4U53_006795, partial [Claviceps sorghi]
MADLDVPIALRRTRRSTAGTAAPKQEEPVAAGPRTPRRRRKAVRFSEPAGSSSGLTPMVRRTHLDVLPGQQRRRASTPAVLCGGGAPPASHVLRHTADGRVERRLRRTQMRNLLNRLDRDRRHRARAARAQMEQLRAEIRRRDREIYELQNATVVIDTERIWDLERQVGLLRGELARRPAAGRGEERTPRPWNDDAAGGDPFLAALDDEYADMMTMMGRDDDDDDDDDRFGDETMAHLVASTPSRARMSFPTPPATSPLLEPTTPTTPTTPRSTRHRHRQPHSHAGVQVCLADAATQQLEEELSSLQRQVGKLTAALDSYKNLGARLKQQLAEVAPLHPAAAAAAEGNDVLEDKVAALLQTAADSAARP